jgi:imidazolonepropionase-like amidohydrolase
MRGVLPVVTLGCFAGVLSAETGRLTIHMILHAIGEENYEITQADGDARLHTTIEYTDRGNKRSNTVDWKAGDSIKGASPFAVQMMMMRAGRLDARSVGHDAIQVGRKPIELERFNISNLIFGREILWMDRDRNLAAAMTFAGGLPMEAVRTEYVEALPQLYRAGVAQEMANLGALAREVRPERTGIFAIVGARLVDGTGSAPVDDSVVIVRDGRIAAAGKVPVPRGMMVVDAKGQTLLPGLWEMHTHYSGVEFGPALLASGITTARDCGGELDFLVAQRRAPDVPSPRLLLAGLVDTGGLKAFGHVTAETPEEGRAVVRRYRDAGFEQIKLYTFLTADVVRAIAAEAHRLGMSVTGHVPQTMNAFEGVEAGMDQINHLNYAMRMMREAGEQKVVEFFRDHRTVIDPTAGWGEMAGHAKEVAVETFEPGILRAPFTLETKYRTLGGQATAEQMKTRLAQTLAAIGVLHQGGVAIVPGSDTGLVGFGLYRELELYVQAGMTPMEAIQSATIVSARAMKLDRDSGTIEAGKRADLVLVNGDPLADIRDLRQVARVVANGRLYDSQKLWHSVGFR